MINNLITPPFSCCLSIFSRFQQITKVFYIFNNRESERQNFYMMIGPQIYLNDISREFVPL